MIIREEFLWVQKYRPKSVQELILPEDIRDTLTSFVEQGSLPNFLFHSQSGGTGKTSAALAIAHQLNLEALILFASLFLQPARCHLRTVGSLSGHRNSVGEVSQIVSSTILPLWFA